MAPPLPLDGSTRSLFESAGFVILRNAFQRKQIDRFANSFHGHIRDDGKYIVTTGLGSGNKQSGWYIPGFPAIESLKHIFTEIVENPKLGDALADLHGGADKYRVLSRNEVYVDWVAQWHKDLPHGPLQRYESGLRNSAILPNNETHAITTCAIYLEDHEEGGPHNSTGLWVMPGSHARRVRPSEVTPTSGLALQSRRGDVVLFNSKLHHRGQSTGLSTSSTRNISRGRDHRSVISITFGRRNAFSDRWEHSRTLLGHLSDTSRTLI
jgi:hypothetical protein